jgi:NAD(P)H-hydrate repair Nnr-like enzyme with NAD(P)H-hydrate epimerase domain
MDLELKEPGDVMQEIARKQFDREQENLPSAYVILGMVEYASLQTRGLTQAIEEPGSGKRTILGLTVLVDGMLGVRVIGAPEDAFNELVNTYAK